MNGDAPVNWLMFFTLAAGVIVAGGAFLGFLRSRHNREIATNALKGDGQSRGIEPSGAAVEQVGLLVVAVIAMGLLVIGYHAKSAANNDVAAEQGNPAGPIPAPSTSGATANSGSSQSAPK